jgi:tRNA (mo5U34)-methyltransferase
MQRARNAETTEGISRLIDQLGKLGWYHSIDLPDGTVIPGIQTIEQLRARIAQYPIPQDLRGKRVLDIGAWDGWFSFEMERRGATVVAVDSARQETFFEAKKLLNSKVEYIVEDICYLTPRDVGYFDIVLFFGVLYHLKHPLLALERVCELTTDMACIETLVTDDPPQPNAIPLLEFYETTELAGQFDNWCGPNTSCLQAFMRTAGFVNVKLLGEHDCRAQAVGYRKWPQVARSGEAPHLVCVENTWTRDHTFRSDRDHYFTIWFTTSQTDLTCDNVFVQVGRYAVRPVGVRNYAATGWQANCKLPFGLAKGWSDVTVAIGNGSWSNAARIPIDLARVERKINARITESLHIAGVTDGRSYEPNRVTTGPNSCLSVWSGGIPDDARESEISVRLDGTDLPATYLSGIDEKGWRQINALLPPQMEPGEYQVAVQFRGQESRPVPLFLERLDPHSVERAPDEEHRNS